MSAAEIAGQQRPTKDATPEAGDNSAALNEDMNKLFGVVDDLGKVAGQGANSLGDLAIAVCGAARAGTINADKKSDHVATIYKRYVEAQNAVRKDDKDGKDVPSFDERAAATHISRLRKFAALGAADWKGNDAASRLAKARDFINTIPRAAMGRSAYTSLFMVASAQLKAIDVKTGKGKALTQEEMRRIVVPPSDAEDNRSTAEIIRDELQRICKALAKVTGGTEDRAPWEAPEVSRCYEMLNTYQLKLAKKIDDEKTERGGGEDEAA